MKPSCAIKALFCTMLFTGAMLSPSWAGEFTVVFADPAWDGKKVPDGQHCKKYGGHGATPAPNVRQLPSLHLAQPCADRARPSYLGCIGFRG